MSVIEIYLNSQRMHWHACESEICYILQKNVQAVNFINLFHGVRSEHEYCL